MPSTELLDLFRAPSSDAFRTASPSMRAAREQQGPELEATPFLFIRNRELLAGGALVLATDEVGDLLILGLLMCCQMEGTSAIW